MKMSIITICYNSENVIKKTIESVLSQSFSDIEYVLIDGNSQDNTLEIIKSYEEKFTAKKMSYKYLSESDDGIYDAMNKGIINSSGDWLLFLNSGDYLVNGETLEEISRKYLNKDDLKVLTGMVNIVSNDYKDMGYTHPNKVGSNLKLLKENCIAHQATFINKEIFKSFGYFCKYKIMMDYDYWIRLLKNDVNIVYANDIVSNFINDGVSSKRDNYKISIEEYLDVLYKYGYVSKLQRIIMKKYKILIFNLKTFSRLVLGDNMSNVIHNNRLKRKK